jgi:hypothetical protein
MRFYQVEPTLENYWRGIILFGKNVASYKFALAHALYDVKRDGSDLILLEDLPSRSASICVAIWRRHQSKSPPPEVSIWMPVVSLMPERSTRMR